MGVDVRESELKAGVQIVLLSGRLDMETADADTPAVMQAVDESSEGVVFDMAGVDFISSSGLRMLIASHNAAQNAGKRIALIRIQSQAHDVLMISSLDSVLRFFEDEAEAIREVWQDGN